MDSISLITINGDMFFIESSYPSSTLKSIEEIAQGIFEPNEIPSEEEGSSVFKLFLNKVQSQLGIALHEVHVRHVFRINR